MDHQERSLRIGAGVILCALLLRLTATGFFRPVAEFFAKPNIVASLIYLETGRIVRFSPSTEPVQEAFAYESPVPDFVHEIVAVTEPPETNPPLPAFAEAQAEEIRFKNSAGVKFDAAALLTQPLQWNLTSGEPTVLILHTHGSESYTPVAGEEYEQTAAFRTLDEDHNMIAVGDHLARLLEDSGIGVVHDRQLHDHPSYNGSYNNARKAIQQYLKAYPSIVLVLDLHRDASGDVNKQMRTEALVNGAESAQIMFVVGTSASGLKHPAWKENLSLALKLQVQMEEIAAGICRNLNLRAQRFNQDLAAGALLVEVGSAGNTREEALTAVEVLAQAVIELAKGTEQ